VRRLLCRRHATRQALQVAFHAGRRTLELLEVFVGQAIEPECAGLVAKFIGHWVLYLVFLFEVAGCWRRLGD
jgi:hypothetical protein